MVKVISLLALFLSVQRAQAAEPFADVRLTSGDEVGCAPAVDVMNGLTVDFPDLDSELDAGESYDYTFAITRSASVDAADWSQEHSFFYFAASTQTPYPARLRLDAADTTLLDFLYADESSRTFLFTAAPRPTFGGDFNLQLTLFLFSPESGYCGVEATFDRGLVIASEHVDMTPPLVRRIAFDHEEYKVGDTVTATITFSEPLRELTTDHVDFENPLLDRDAPGRSFPGFLSNDVYTFAATDTPNTYQLTFTVPAEAQPGEYFLAWLNRFDAAGNFEDQVGAVDEEEMTVALNKPLRVVAP